MSSAHFEVRKLSIEDMELSPKVFFTERDGYAVMGKAAHYAQFRVEGIDTPVYYFRNITPEGQRWAGISCFGATPLTPQTGLHGDDLAQGETPSTRYRKVCDNPKTYEIETQEPYSRIRYIDDGQGGVILECREGKDGCILDIRAVPFPVAVISHANQDQPAPYFQVNTVVTGTYMGRPIRGMGGFDRTFVVNHKTAGTAKIEADYAATYRCCCALYSGIREDGRKECVYALITNQNGKGIGMYYLDGEPTFVSENVRLDAKFCHLPYVDDGTVVYTAATWTIGTKVIHFDGKWGTKGFTAYPKLEKHGQSQCFGSWYAGDTPYPHVVSHSFNENSGDAYADRIRSLGFTVTD